MTVTVTLSIPNPTEHPTVMLLVAENTGEEVRYLSLPHLGEPELGADCFRFNHASVLYMGKRSPEPAVTGDQMTPLAPGATYESLIDLTFHYLLPTSGHTSLCYTATHPLGGTEETVERLSSNWVLLPASNQAPGEVPATNWWKRPV